jgi:uncharacterized OsmC-like protein
MRGTQRSFLLSQRQQSIYELTTFLSEHPDKCRHPDKAASAVVEEGLRCRAEGPSGATLISDMPKSIGGGGATPTPGWFFRAALATCDTTVIAMRAAQLGVTLTTLAVTVESESDDRGLLRTETESERCMMAATTFIRFSSTLQSLDPKMSHYLV